MLQSKVSSDFEESESVSLGDLIYKFIPYWPFFLILALIGITGAWIYLRYKLPMYQTQATILIKDDKTSSYNSNLMDAFDMFGSKKNVQNEVEVLHSKTLMQEVVKNLHLYAPITAEGRVLNQSAYLISPIIVEAKAVDSFRGASKVPFKFSPSGQSVKISNSVYPLNQWVATSYGILQFLPNKYYRGEDIQSASENFYFSLINVKSEANSILGQIKIAPSGNQSTVINLSVIGEIPKRGEDILNELLKVYNQAAILDKNVLAANTLKFVEDRLKFVSNDLDSIENQLQHFKANNKITDISAQGQMFLQTVATNDQKISDINMQLAVLDQVENYVVSKEGSGGIVPATLGVPDPVLTDLLTKLSGAELQYAQTKKIVPENNPTIIALQDGINKLKPAILENIRNQRSNLVAARNDLTGTSGRYSSMLKTIPEKERELLSISRQQAIKNNIYTFLLQKREETALSFASAIADSRIIDRAQSSDSPVGPKSSVIYLAALVASLAVGIALIIAKELLTRTVQQRSDIEKFTSIPFLGDVNYDVSKSDIVIAEGKRSFIAEQFRQLRTSLGYMGIAADHKRILITSSISGEGKSFISINLGISLALMGKKVVLLELDLRKPRISDQLKISRNSGISNYLIDAASSEELIKSTSIENLFLIPSGPIPPNPSELLSNGKLLSLLEKLEESFDYIIMDTAPITPVTDAFILSPFANVTLFIVRHDFTPKQFLQRLEERYKMDNLKNPAIIYNGVKGKGFKKYGYGYGYGYGYLEEESRKSWWDFLKKA